MHKKIDTKTRVNKTVSLKEELDEFMKYFGVDGRMQEMKIYEAWETCVGESIAKHSAPVEIKNYKLFVKAENAVWRYELSLRKTEIIESLNKVLNKSIIKEIVFR
jgi:predicted nucleic acid-binding Zn ribbon protein